MTIQHIDLSGPLDAATPLATIAAMSRQGALQDQERQQNTLQLQRLAQQLQESKKKADDEKAVTDIIKTGGSPEEVSQKLLKAGFPDQSRTYLTNSQADTLQQQQQADQRFRDLQGSVAPGADVATPQTTTAPIQTSLTDPSQISQPQVSEPGTARAEVPLPSVTKHYIGQPDTVLQPQSRNQLTLAEQARQAFAARLEVQKKNAEITVIPKDAEAFQNGAVIASNVKKEPGKVNFSNDGIPYSVTGPDKTEYVIGDSKMPPDLKREADAAVASHAQRIKEKIDQEDRLNANASERADENNKRQTERQTGVPDPRLANVPASNQKDVLDKVHKVEDEHAAAQAATDRMNTVLSLAKSGNKEAQASASLIGVQAINELANVKRVNQAEISNYGNAGSLIDRLEGSIGKIVAGKPIPDDVLEDMQALHDAFAVNTDKTYQRKLQSIDRTYRSNFAGAAGSGSLDDALDKAFGKPKGK